jgi:hypothetical protein
MFLNRLTLVIGGVLGFSFALLIYKAPFIGIEAFHERELSSQASELQAHCEEEKKITKDVSHEYQTKLSSLNAQLARLKRVQSHCIVPGTAGGRDGEAERGKPSGPDGVSTAWLLEFAGEAERYRLQLISCQDFIRRVHD